MDKISQSARLVKNLLFLLIIALVCHLSACHPGEAKGDQHINPDTIKHHILPIGQAVQYTASFRASIENFNKNAAHFADSMRFGHAESFPSDVFLELLNQGNDKQGKAVGIRIYYGRDTTGLIRLILVPYDSSGNDIINHMVDLNGKPVSGQQIRALTTTTDGQTLQDGLRCPTVCDDGSSGLN